MKPKRLLDLKVDEQILGKGIFSNTTQNECQKFSGMVQSTDTSLSNSLLIDENLGQGGSMNSNIPSSRMFDNHNLFGYESNNSFQSVPRPNA